MRNGRRGKARQEPEKDKRQRTRKEDRMEWKTQGWRVRRGVKDGVSLHGCVCDEGTKKVRKERTKAR